MILHTQNFFSSPDNVVSDFILINLSDEKLSIHHDVGFLPNLQMK